MTDTAHLDQGKHCISSVRIIWKQPLKPYCCCQSWDSFDNILWYRGNAVLPFPGAIFGFAMLQGLDCHAAVRVKCEYVNEALMELYSYKNHPVIVSI